MKHVGSGLAWTDDGEMEHDLKVHLGDRAMRDDYGLVFETDMHIPSVPS
jgi:hypothetical protein